MADVPYIFFSLVCVLFNIAPLCWHIEHRNSGPICLGFWVILFNVFTFINAIVWADDAIDRAPIFCDISIKIFIAAPSAIVCANICIMRFLARVLKPGAGNISYQERRHMAYFDYALCTLVPVFLMATQIIYQPVRYGISTTVGCTVAIVLSWPTYVCFLLWTPVLSCIGCVFSSCPVYVLWRLYCHRRDLRKVLNGSSTALTTSRFVRLALLAICSFACTMPLSIYTVLQAAHVPSGYIDYDWAFIHQSFSTILFDPFLRKATIGNWASVIAGLLVLAFFGFGGEAMSYYGKLARILYLDHICHKDSNLKGISSSEKVHRPAADFIGLRLDCPAKSPCETAQRIVDYDMDLDSPMKHGESESLPTYHGPFYTATPAFRSPRATATLAEGIEVVRTKEIV